MRTETLYPLKLRPTFKEKIWGGRNLARLLGKHLPADARVGESWEIADESLVVQGAFVGRRLVELVEAFGEHLVGSLVAAQAHHSFPLLVKFIDAQERLSVQVHPDDCFARREEAAPCGKTEMWYVLAAAPAAEIIHGVSAENTRIEEIASLATSGLLMNHLHRVPVSAGDVIFIPAGTVHAIGEGLVICEVQQNCDLTYRLYDWDRLTPEGQPRELHVAKAVRASVTGPSEHKVAPVVVKHDYGRRTVLVACRYFASELLELVAPQQRATDERSFVTLLSLKGEGEICWQDTSISVFRGESVVIPANLGRYELRPIGRWTVMIAYVPDLMHDIVEPLLAAGVGLGDILRLGGDRQANDLVDLLQRPK